MLEGRGNTSGWLLVAVAIVALIAFTGLLYVRGGSGSPTLQTGRGPTPSPALGSAGPSGSVKPGGSAKPVGSVKPAGSGATAASSARPGASGAAASPGKSPVPTASGLVAGATSRLSAAPTKTPRPTATPAPTATNTPADSGYRLPRSPQSASVALQNGQGDCPNFPTGGVLAQTSFTQSSAGKLTANSPSKHLLTGRIQANGSFSLSGTNPVERWVGTLSDTGGTGSYFVVSNGCTEGYETTIAFAP